MPCPYIRIMSFFDVQAVSNQRRHTCRGNLSATYSAVTALTAKNLMQHHLPLTNVHVKFSIQQGPCAPGESAQLIA